MAKRVLSPTSEGAAFLSKKPMEDNYFVLLESHTPSGPVTPQSIKTPDRHQSDFKAFPDPNARGPLTGRVVHHHSCLCLCGALSIDHTAFPHIIDSILLHVSFRTLLAFRGTSKYFRERIDTSLRHLVVTERPSGTPTNEPKIHIKTAKGGYTVLESGASMYLASMCPSGFRPDHINKTARAVANCLRRINDRGFQFPPMLIVDVVGKVRKRVGNKPHLLFDFLAALGRIRQVRYLPDSPLTGVVCVPRNVACDLIVLNDWKAPPRTVELAHAGTVPNVIYRFNARERLDGKFINTVVKAAKTIVYDFTESRMSKLDKAIEATLLAPAHYFVRNAAHYLCNGARIVIAGTPWAEWFHPSYAASRELKKKYPTVLSWTLHLLRIECGRTGCCVNGRITLIDAASPDRLIYLPRSYWSVEDVKGPAMIVANAAGKYVW